MTQKKSEDGEEFEVGHLGPSDYFGKPEASFRGTNQLMSCSACRGDCIVTKEA